MDVRDEKAWDLYFLLAHGFDEDDLYYFFQENDLLENEEYVSLLIKGLDDESLEIKKDYIRAFPHIHSIRSRFFHEKQERWGDDHELSRHMGALDSILLENNIIPKIKNLIEKESLDMELVEREWFVSDCFKVLEVFGRNGVLPGTELHEYVFDFACRVPSLKMTAMYSLQNWGHAFSGIPDEYVQRYSEFMMNQLKILTEDGRIINHGLLMSNLLLSANWKVSEYLWENSKHVPHLFDLVSGIRSLERKIHILVQGHRSLKNSPGDIIVMHVLDEIAKHGTKENEEGKNFLHGFFREVTSPAMIYPQKGVYESIYDRHEPFLLEVCFHWAEATSTLVWDRFFKYGRTVPWNRLRHYDPSELPNHSVDFYIQLVSQSQFDKKPELLLRFYEDNLFDLFAENLKSVLLEFLQLNKSNFSETVLDVFLKVSNSDKEIMRATTANLCYEYLSSHVWEKPNQVLEAVKKLQRKWGELPVKDLDAIYIPPPFLL